MNEVEIIATDLRERLAKAAPFDQVSIARYLAEDMPPWPTDLSIEGEGDIPSRLAALLSVALESPDEIADLEPQEADELVALLFPIALADRTLTAPIHDAVKRHERDESMNAIEILAQSAAISLVIAVATTEIEWKKGKCIRIVKKSIGDKALVKLVEILEKVCGLKGL